MSCSRAALCVGTAVLATLGCEGSLEGATPSLREVTPAVVCSEPRIGEEAAVALLGSGFSPLPLAVPEHASLALPSVGLMHAWDLDGSAGTSLESWFRGEPGGAGSKLLRWVSHEEMTLLISSNMELDGARLSPGIYDVRVHNPNGRTSTLRSGLAVTTPSRVTAVEPAIACVGSGGQIRVSAPGSLQLDGALPRLRLGGATLTASAALDCVDVPLSSVEARLCDTLVVDLADGLMTGATSIEVENPSAGGCALESAPDDVTLVLVEAPVIEEVERDTLCQPAAEQVELLFRGRGFVRVGDTDFTVLVGGEQRSPWAIEGCVPVDSDVVQAASCRSFRITLDARDLPLGPIAVEVHNPPPASCMSSTSSVLEIVGPPLATSVSPAELCSDVPATLLIEGGDLSGTTSATIGERTASVLLVDEDGQLSATFNEGLPAGAHDIVLSAGGACAASSTVPLVVSPTPRPLLVDPPVVLVGLESSVTVFTNELVEPPAAITIVDAAGAATALPFTANAALTSFTLTVPRALAAGSYEVNIVASSGCESLKPARLLITAGQPFALSDVRPAYVSSSAATEIIIAAEPSAGAAIESGARAYLRRAGADEVTHSLRAALLRSPRELSAVVPSGLAAGEYDVVVVNPSGSAAVLAAALSVGTRAPPRISSLRPRSLVAGVASSLLVSGGGFDEDPATVLVAAECVSFTTGAAVPAPVLSVDMASSTSLQLFVDAAAMSPGAVCSLTVRNSDGSAGRGGSLSFRDPTQPIRPWLLDEPMPEARRGHALVLSPPGEGEAWLYAIGGDGGNGSDVKTSIDAAPVDAFGRVGTWVRQRNTLSDVQGLSASSRMPRAFVGAAAIGRFVYLVGGRDDQSASDTLLRAQILHERALPELSGVEAHLADADRGLDVGIWSWRVSTLFANSDANNPGGESVAGEAVSLAIPEGADPLAVALSWQPVPGARGYRVYRANLTSGEVAAFALVAETAAEHATLVIDDGLLAEPSAVPYVPGALGRWHVVRGAKLGVPRAGHATVAVPDPSSSERTFLYAIGGRNDGGVHASGERAVITVAANGEHSVGAFTPLSATLAVARAEIGGFSVTHDDAEAALDGEAFVFVTGGAAASSTFADLEAARLEPSGDVLSFTTVRGPMPARSGSAAFAANGSVLLLGGTSGQDSTASLTPPMPRLGSWSTAGAPLLEPRLHMGTATRGVFVFVAGGQTQNDSASDSVERTVR